jgi:hypothetical protein
MHLIMHSIVLWLPNRNLCKNNNNLIYKEGNSQEGVKTGIAVYIDELIELKFLFVIFIIT